MAPGLAFAEPQESTEAASPQPAAAASPAVPQDSAPAVSSAAPQQQQTEPAPSPAQQPGVVTDTADRLKGEVDALMKLPPPALSPTDAPEGQQSAADKAFTNDAKQSVEAQQQATLEEQQRKSKGRKKGRIRELEEIRSELAEKELVLLGKEQELLDKDQTVEVLRKELEIERKLRGLLTKDKQKAEEEAALAIGLCRSVP